MLFWEGVSLYEKGQEPAGRSKGVGAIGVGVRSLKSSIEERAWESISSSGAQCTRHGLTRLTVSPRNIKTGYYDSNYLHFSWAGQRGIFVTRLSKKRRACGQEANRTASAHNDGSQTSRRDHRLRYSIFGLLS